MEQSGATFTHSSGKPPNEWWLTVVSAAQVQPGDVALQYAGEKQKERILERTAAGVDVDGIPFEPYNSTRPYYWYPRSGGAAHKRIASADRAHRKLGEGTRTIARAGGSGLGIKFPSYAAAKAAFGRAVVDLFGLHGAPHMLQAIIVKVTGLDLTIGIYGDEAKRAEAINEGLGNQPRRHFFGASEGDLRQMGSDVMDFIMARVKKVL